MRHALSKPLHFFGAAVSRVADDFGTGGGLREGLVCLEAFRAEIDAEELPQVGGPGWLSPGLHFRIGSAFNLWLT